MKYFTTLFFIFFILTLHGQQLLTPPNANKKEVKLINNVIKDYLDDDKALIIFNPYAPLFIGFYGVTYQYDKNICLFSLSAVLSDRDKRNWVLLHEMGHVLDIMYGDLSEYPPMWKGKRMDHNLEWQERPWEQHADEWAKRLWKKYLEGDPPIRDIQNELDFPHDCIFHKFGSIKFKGE